MRPILLLMPLTLVACSQVGPPPSLLAVPPTATLALRCDDSAVSLWGPDNSDIGILCPPGCQGSVWGTDTYTADSSICTAAIHAGALTDAGGTARLHLLAGRAGYPGGYRNGIMSSSWGDWHSSFAVSRAGGWPAPRYSDDWHNEPQVAARAFGCHSHGQELDPGSDEPIEVHCPRGCGAQGVWGTGVYTDDSAICSAAIHAGALTRDGGAVVIQFGGGQPQYPASTSYGIASNEWGSWGRSFQPLAASCLLDAASDPFGDGFSSAPDCALRIAQ